ncbi:MAG: hypothetical protein D3904_14590 [Candidatus Electrothrix sp. EH2]|nr:hypothetical protein [Candidatus Electrothrix sp. EH2]
MMLNSWGTYGMGGGDFYSQRNQSMYIITVRDYEVSLGKIERPLIRLNFFDFFTPASLTVC